MSPNFKNCVDNNDHKSRGGGEGGGGIWGWEGWVVSDDNWPPSGHPSCGHPSSSPVSRAPMKKIQPLFIQRDTHRPDLVSWSVPTANTKRWNNAGIALAQRRRRWINITLAMFNILCRRRPCRGFPTIGKLTVHVRQPWDIDQMLC